MFWDLTARCCSDLAQQGYLKYISKFDGQYFDQIPKCKRNEAIKSYIIDIENYYTGRQLAYEQMILKSKDFKFRACARFALMFAKNTINDR